MQGGKNRIFRKRNECKPVLLRLSLAGNLEKPLMSLYGTECGGSVALDCRETCKQMRRSHAATLYKTAID
jgi:hypothetical protein